MTIEVPTPSADLISQIETATIETDQAEVAAVRAIRERFAPYAKHNGTIQTADYDLVTSNYIIERAAYYQPEWRGETPCGKRVKGLLACNLFDTSNTDQNRGTRGGFRLYLTERGWLELERVGHWTQWQGEAQWWYTDAASMAAIELDEDRGERPLGSIRSMTDEEVAAEYDVETILTELGKTMAEMCKKLPERFGKLKARAELAQRIIGELGNPNANARR